MKSIALIGFMGSGKSTVGPLLATIVAAEFVDLDMAVTAAAGMTVAEVFDREGELGWRLREQAALLEMVMRGRIVLACGGGVILSAENRETLARGFRTVYLHTSPDVLLERLRDGSGRPLLDAEDPEAVLKQLYRERLPVYEEAAEVTISTDGKTPQELADEIMASVKEKTPSE